MYNVRGESSLGANLKFRKKITKQDIADFSFIMFFSITPLESLCGWLLGHFSYSHYNWFLAVLIIYTPLLLIVFLSNQFRSLLDFIFLLGIIAIIFLTTYAIFPQYENWFNHRIYGVIPYIFRPDRGLYAYLLIRICKDPKNMLKNLKIVAFVSIIYGFFEFAMSLYRGYWLTYSPSTFEWVESPYSLTFGYDMLLPAIVFAYFATRGKKIVYSVLSFISILMILLGGSRGPLLWVAIFFVILFLKNSNKIIKKTYILFLIPLVPLLVYIGYSKIMELIISLFNNIGISSRSIEMFLTGNIGDENGRNEIWELALDMIRKGGPFGYGAYGDRYVIGNYFSFGYSHNIFLELLVSFGIVGGGFLICLMLYYTIKMFLTCKDSDWMGIFIIFFALSLKLVLSDSLWYNPFFWGTFAIVVSYHKQLKSSKRYYTNKNKQILKK
ncbi:O-antigen ligase family protein [Heyndrickxia sporothermodurans]|uniref:O-antigen ligase family protein n=1 Tax=Heyndrickxia sporothermodurans TaxID=46224 RepID=UPI002E1F613A|nr:O-antigen ligase family protein [Heyndrickxia sporothermodurans]